MAASQPKPLEASTLTVTGTATATTLTATGVALAGNGSVGAPSYSFSSDTDTGIWLSAAGRLGVASGGVQIIDAFAGPQISFLLPSKANGTGATFGNTILVGGNTSGSGTAGFLDLIGANGNENIIWADSSGTPGVLRISTAAPQEDGTPADTSGTVVGSQSSALDTKDVLGDGIAPSEALSAILLTPVKHFRYKGGSYNGTEFHGIIADDSPQFAMDPDAAHPHGRSFNPVSAFGYTVQAFKAMQDQIAELRAEIEALKR